MRKFYVHVRPFQASPEQVEKFKEIMSNFGFYDFIKENDIDYQLPPGGFVGTSKAGSEHVVDQTFSIANTAGFDAYIFACEFINSARLLRGYGI